MANRAENSTILSPQGAVSLLRGIGDIRAKALAELNIYSIQDFLEYTETEDGILHVAGKIGLKADAVNDLRSQTEGEFRTAQHASVKPKWHTRRSFTYILLAVLNILIIIAGILIEATSFYHFHDPVYSVTALFDTIPTFPASYYKMRVTSEYTGVRVNTKVVIDDQYDPCFGSDVSTNIPEGFLFKALIESDFLEADAKIHIIERKPVKLREGWYTLEDVREITFPLSLKTEIISGLENYSGDNLIIWINTDSLNDIQSALELMRQYECHFYFAANFIDNINANIFDSFRKGVARVLPLIYYDEAKYMGIEDLPDDGFGPILKLEKRVVPADYGIYQVEYFWIPNVQGEFIRPEDLVGSPMFIEIEHGERVETGFSFKTDGAQWLIFVVGLFGLQAIFGAVRFVRKKFER